MKTNALSQNTSTCLHRNTCREKRHTRVYNIIKYLNTIPSHIVTIVKVTFIIYVKNKKKH